MTRNLVHLLSALLIGSALAGCGMLEAGSPPTDEEATRPVIIGTATPLEAEGQSLDGSETAPPAATTPTVASTPPPRMSAWPLEADLFYLNDAGQVWRQPLEGDETSAASVTRLDQVVLDFAVAPGGDWLLYRTDAYILLSSVDGQSGQILDDNLGVPVEHTFGPTLAWSPDAGQMAYSTATGFRLYVPGAGAESGPQVFDVPEGQPSAGLVWSADSHWLYSWRADGTLAIYLWDGTLLSPIVTLSQVNSAAWLSDNRLAWAPVEGGLAVVQPTDLEARVFVAPQDQQVSLIGQQADGDIVFFLHGSDLNNPGLLHVAIPDDLSFQPAGGKPLDTTGMRWAPGGSRLIGPDPDDPASLLIVDPATGASDSIETAGAAHTLAWGDPPPQQVKSLPLSADLFFMAPDDAGIIQVYRLPGNGEPAEVLTDAIADVTAYAISDDGENLAYASEGIIYATPIGSLVPAQVATISQDALNRDGTLDFSPDGTKLAYTSFGIWVVEIGAGQPIRLVRDRIPTRPEEERLITVYSRPEWSPDGEWLLIRANFYEGYDLALLRSNAPNQPILLDQLGSEARWMADNRLLAYGAGYYFSTPGMFVIEPGTRPEAIQLVELPIVDALARAEGQIAALVRSSSAISMGPTSVRVFGITLNPEGDDPPVLDLAAETGAVALEMPRLSPDGTLIAGLHRPRYDEFGRLTGRLAIVNPATGELFVLEGFERVFNVQWGP